MKRIFQLVLISIWLHLNACTTSKTVSNTELLVKYTIKPDRVNFSIKNRSRDKVLFPNLENFYLEVWEEEKWERLPYMPCKCGTPCAAPVPTYLSPKEQSVVNWNYISRKCRGIESNETIYDTGRFRIRFRYQILDQGIIVKNETQWVEFSF